MACEPTLLVECSAPPAHSCLSTRATRSRRLNQTAQPLQQFARTERRRKPWRRAAQLPCATLCWVRYNCRRVTGRTADSRSVGCMCVYVVRLGLTGIGDDGLLALLPAFPAVPEWR